MMSPTSPEAQVRFLANIQRILDEGAVQADRQEVHRLLLATGTALCASWRGR